jgi:type VI secretion system protein ImpH
MATESGNPNAVVTGTNENMEAVPSSYDRLRRMLKEEHFRVHFFQAVRLLQKMEPGRKPVGYFVLPEGETIRFASRTSLAFPASEIHNLQTSPHGQVAMTVEFMGLCAAISVMPTAYTEFLISQKDNAMEEFLNIFNHRMISLFYRGWEKYRFYIEYERSQEDKLSDRLMDFLGLGTQGLRDRGRLADRAYLNYVGLLARRVRSASSLQQILEDYFLVKVQVKEFAGAWRKLAIEDRTCLNGGSDLSERLGIGTVAGDEVWDHHGRIRIMFGPMRLQEYLRFLPGNDAYCELAAWLTFYSNGCFESEVQLILDREDAPQCELGAIGEGRPRLGLVSWLKTKPLDRDPLDATYLVQ